MCSSKAESKDKTILEMRNICKSFAGVQVLFDVDFDLKEAEVHALVGENGAGKTTLMNILNGVLCPDKGKIILKGKEQKIQNPHQAQDMGIAFIHQELNLIDPLSVKENIYLGKEPKKRAGLLHWEKVREKTSELFSRLGLNIGPDEKIENLKMADQQMVEIAKALSFDAYIIVMDEPTSSLTEEETEKLFNIIRDLKTKGCSIIYISHRLEEIFEIADRVTVLRNGRQVGSRKIEETDRNHIVKMMVGKEIQRRYLKEKIKKGAPVLKVKELHTEDVRNVSFELRSGEILGVAGLLGSGRTELLEAIYRYRKIVSGSIQLNGNKINIKSPMEAIRAGITYLPEDREKKGLFLNLDVKENICVMSLPEDVKFGFIDEKKQRVGAKKIIQQMRIVTPSIFQTVNHLSGGNKQKVVLAKCIRSKTKVLLMDEPTRGIDVGAKVEIYGLMQEICKKGAGIIMVSSELPEVLEISDKILVMHEGEMVALFDREKANKEKLMRAMTGYTKEKARRG